MISFSGQCQVGPRDDRIAAAESTPLEIKKLSKVASLSFIILAIMF